MRLGSKTRDDGSGREGRVPWAQMAGGQADQGGRDACRMEERLTSEDHPMPTLPVPRAHTPPARVHTTWIATRAA